MRLTRFRGLVLGHLDPRRHGHGERLPGTTAVAVGIVARFGIGGERGVLGRGEGDVDPVLRRSVVEEAERHGLSPGGPVRDRRREEEEDEEK